MKKISKKINKQIIRTWLNRIIFVLVVAVGVTAYIIYINSFDAYDFSHLTRTFDLGESRAFTPLGGTNVPGMLQAAQSEFLELYVNPETTNIAVFDRRNGYTWHSSPPETNLDPIAIPFQQNVMRSNMGFEFFDAFRRTHTRWLYNDSVAHEYQFEIFSIWDGNEVHGIRLEYQVGDMDMGIDAIPFFMEIERFNTRVLPYVDPDDWQRVQRFWFESRDMEGFMQMSDAIRDRQIDIGIMLRIFENIGYTADELIMDNAAAGIELDIDQNFFKIVMEFVLLDDALKVNIPLSEIEVVGDDAHIFQLDVLPFLGAGGVSDEGFILVPSGSGGIINFNNGRHREAMFEAPMYGFDYLMDSMRPQITQAARLPIFGIQNEGAAMLAHVYSGQALASVIADVAGRTNSYNSAWFRFTLRASTILSMAAIPGTTTSDLTIIQTYPYTGDITVKYHFIAGDNPGIGEMARTYQDFLVSQGALSPLTENRDRSFYLDIIGGIDIQRHILGTPYMATEAMTTIEDAQRFVDILNENGIDTIQMQLHGWFNRGINHDVARNVNIISDVGSASEMRNLDNRLQSNHGGLHPAVNFQFTNWFSRNFNSTFEGARDPAGFVGFMSQGARDSLSTRFSFHRNGWHLMVHPAALPFHVDDFLPNFERRVGMNSMMLTDLGAVMTESMYRRDAVDREHSRLIAMEQMERIHAQIPNLVVSGGNDYAFAFASHLVDVPTEADMFKIIDYEVPFYSMVVHGFIEFAGTPANMRENYSPEIVLLNSLATGASPRYILSAQPTRHAQFSPHERFYSTQYTNWIEAAVEHFHVFNDVYRNLRAVRIDDFIILQGGEIGVTGTAQVTVTVFEDGTRIYVNHTREPFDNGDVFIAAEGFYVRNGGSV
ncbi:MAG: DUF5696 domain-containing protein [Defluviitaleaceae bacterium]|nr:DUF5696 domain-containing protein [Defluviitaleaceae bacterium]